MSLNLQPQLQNRLVRMAPLVAADFEPLYAVASDPLIWEQHPNRDRYQRDVFQNFFKGAMESGGAFLVRDQLSGAIMGSSRYYDLAPDNSSVAIGYTFIARQYWGKEYNLALKTLMLDHAFGTVETVLFHVGINNRRSRKAMEKLGGILIGEQPMAYYGEVSSTNVVYRIGRAQWRSRPAAIVFV